MMIQYNLHGGMEEKNKTKYLISVLEIKVFYWTMLKPISVKSYSVSEEL